MFDLLSFKYDLVQQKEDVEMPTYPSNLAIAKKSWLRPNYSEPQILLL